MALIITDNQHYSNIASAIRTKLGTNETFAPAEMASAIMSISDGGGSVTQDQDGYIVLPSDGGGGGGGGGGSSDFSTATVTITSNTENDFELWANNVDGANMYSDIASDDIDGSADFEIVLYKGRGLVWPKNYHNFIISSVSGDITVSENVATVTGNGTITIS